MDGAARKAAIATYKERKPTAGIFAIRCLVSGQTWVGASGHLDTQQNGIWFSLRHGGHPRADLQRAWSEHGEDAFVFETLERLDETLSPMARQTAMKERAGHWRAKQGALPV